MNRRRFTTMAVGAGVAALGSSATAGGLSSGIDLALRVVERYLGRDASDATAELMEYERSSVAIA